MKKALNIISDTEYGDTMNFYQTTRRNILEESNIVFTFVYSLVVMFPNGI
jgi:hypothetical protein